MSSAPALSLDFGKMARNGMRLDPLVTYTNSGGSYWWGPNQRVCFYSTGQTVWNYNSITDEIDGVLTQGSSTNRLLYNYDLSTAPWVSSGMSVELATDLHGVSGYAWILSAQTSNAYIEQTIADATGRRRVASFYVRRVKNQNGTIKFSLNSGANMVTAASISHYRYQRFSTTGSGAASTFRIEVSAQRDAIAVMFPQVEDNTWYPGPLIPTTGAARVQSPLSVTIPPVPYGKATATWAVEYTMPWSQTSAVSFASSEAPFLLHYQVNASNAVTFGMSAGGNQWGLDRLIGGVADVTCKVTAGPRRHALAAFTVQDNRLAVAQDTVVTAIGGSAWSTDATAASGPIKIGRFIILHRARMWPEGAS